MMRIWFVKKAPSSTVALSGRKRERGEAELRGYRRFTQQVSKKRRREKKENMIEVQ
jgi:hypothetical protein